MQPIIYVRGLAQARRDWGRPILQRRLDCLSRDGRQDGAGAQARLRRPDVRLGSDFNYSRVYQNGLYLVDSDVM
jgi:hypothetical protein